MGFFLVRPDDAARARPVDTADMAHTVTLVSAQGGSGKTTLATNLGAVLARRPGETTVLADLNLEFPAAALSLGVRPPVTIGSVVDANPEIADDEFDSMLAHHFSGLRLLSGSMEPGQSELINPAGLGAVLDRLYHLYDHVVIDCRPSFRDLYLDIWESSDQILVVCPPNVVSVGLNKNLVEAMNAIGVGGSQLVVVFNHVVPTQRLRRNVVDRQFNATTVEIPYGGPDLHHDEDDGRVHALSHPKEPTARAIQSLADQLTQGWQVETAAMPTGTMQPAMLAAI